MRRDRLGVRREVLDPLAPRPHDRRLDDLLDVGRVRVVSAELPLGVVAKPLLEQRTEDLRIDLAPVESARDAQQTELLAIEMHVRRPFEEAAVRERHAGVETVLRARPTRIVQDRVQTAEVVSTRPSALGEQSVHDPGKAVAGDLAEVLGEHRPNALEQEVPQHVRGSGLPLAEAMVDLGDVLHRLARERGLTAGEDGLVAREELERVVLLRQLAQLERTARSLGEPAGLPDLEPAKRTEDDEPWSLDAELGVGGITPVVERLRAVAGQASRLRRGAFISIRQTRGQIRSTNRPAGGSSNRATL